MGRTAWLVVLAACGVAPGAGAQRVTVGLTGSGLDFDSASATLKTGGALVGLDFRGARSAAFLTGAASAFEGGTSWSLGASGSTLTAPLDAGGAVLGEFAGSAQGSLLALEETAWFGVVSASANLHVRGRSVGAWGGALGQAGGNTAIDVSTTAAGPAGGVWFQLKQVVATASGSVLQIRGEWVPEAVARVRGSGGPLDVQANVGHRPARLGLNAVTWANLEVVAWLTPSVGLATSVGSFPPELIQRLPGGRYVSLRLQWTNRRRQVHEPTPQSPAPLLHEEGGVLLLELAGAERVELMGDWTNWQPVPLVRRDRGRWAVEPMPGRGTWRYAIRVDGGRWDAPPGAVRVDDGFGGTVAVVVVP